ncbi:hypothetical protein HMPREF1550_00216 [Actinomyces sp. oral taxon 877 str. F0543]|nr:hypothetical protein HMPREF1550_00216 [Actinomyces sp. oral taxon 877 str. F0543]
MQHEWPVRRVPRGSCPRSFLVSHTGKGIGKHGAAHKGGIAPLCAVRVL